MITAWKIIDQVKIASPNKPVKERMSITTKGTNIVEI